MSKNLENDVKPKNQVNTIDLHAHTISQLTRIKKHINAFTKQRKIDINSLAIVTFIDHFEQLFFIIDLFSLHELQLFFGSTLHYTSIQKQIVRCNR